MSRLARPPLGLRRTVHQRRVRRKGLGGLRHSRALSNLRYRVAHRPYQPASLDTGVTAPARPLTPAERAEAQRVFGGALALERISLREHRVMGGLGYARALPWRIYFPPGAFSSPGFIPWLIHELTHAWQYQHGISFASVVWHALRREYDYGGEAGLRTALAAGRRFTDFNTEQQGDILRDFFLRDRAGLPTSAWEPFVEQVRHPRTLLGLSR